MTSTADLYLSIRFIKNNPNHHLWLNNGTWWCNFTLKPTAGRSKRVRKSLKTADLQKARISRDKILLAVRAASGRISV